MLRALKNETPSQMGQANQVDVGGNHIAIGNSGAAAAADSRLRLRAANESLYDRIHPHSQIVRYSSADRRPSRDD
jgi:hypothetical protein